VREGIEPPTSNGRREKDLGASVASEMEDPMLVKFVDGPLDGQERTLDDESIEEGGAVITLPSSIAEDEIEIPGDETKLSYLYEGAGIARYIAGVSR
jgi:hypothetical protein